MIWALQYFCIDIKDGELSEKVRTPTVVSWKQALLSLNTGVVIFVNNLCSFEWKEFKHKQNFNFNLLHEYLRLKFQHLMVCWRCYHCEPNNNDTQGWSFGSKTNITRWCWVAKRKHPSNCRRRDLFNVTSVFIHIYSKVIVILLSPCCDHQVRENLAPTDGHIQL